jgi:hypothetical protein
MALPVAGEIDALATLHCKRGNTVHRSSSGCTQRQGVISRASISSIICTSGASRPFLHHQHQRTAGESLTSLKQPWRSPHSLIGNLVSIRESASPVLSSRRALECVFPRGTSHDRAALISDKRGILKNVVTLRLRCCCLPWVGFAGGSRRALRTGSPRILCRCPLLRRQVLGLCRRVMGAQSRRD